MVFTNSVITQEIQKFFIYKIMLRFILIHTLFKNQGN